NIDRLRHSFEDRFDDDAGARLLAALHLANARAFMLHVRCADDHPSRLSIDATWSVRSEPETRVQLLRMTTEPPVKTAPPPPPPDVHSVMPTDWASWATGILDAYAAVLTERDARAFTRERRVWSSRRLPVMARFTGAAPTAA